MRATDGALEDNVSTRAGRATYQDVLDAPEHQVAEVIDGTLYTHPRPAPRHITASSRLTIEIGGPFDRGRGGPGGWRILDEPELHHDRVVVVDGLAVPARHGGLAVYGEPEGIVPGGDGGGRGGLARDRRSYRVAVRVGEAQGPVVEAPHVEAALVHQAMVHRAQQHEVVERGLSALGPVAHVVPVQATGGRAAGEAAAAVAAQERTAKRGGNAAGAPAHAQGLSPRPVHGCDDAPITAQPSCGLRREGAVVLDFTAARLAVGEHLGIDVHHHLVAVGTEGRGLPFLEHPLGHPRQGVGPAHGVGRSLRVSPPWDVGGGVVPGFGEAASGRRL